MGIVLVKQHKRPAHISILRTFGAHCYCISLVCTQFIRHALAMSCISSARMSRNSTKQKADDLCINLVCKYFCQMLGDPHFFSSRSLPFLILSIILKNCTKICIWEVLIICHILLQIGSNWYMDGGVRDLEGRLILPYLMTFEAKIY